MRGIRLAGAMTVLLLILVGCVQQPTPTPSPTPTATPSPVPRFKVDLDATGADLITQIPATEAACVRERLGTDYDAFANVPLTDVTGLLANGSVVSCFSAATLSALIVAGLDAQTGGISDESAACIGSITSTFGANAAVISESQQDGLGSIVSLLLCLTDEEASQVFVEFPGSTGPMPVSLADIRCISARADTADVVTAFAREPNAPLPEAIIEAMHACNIKAAP